MKSISQSQRAKNNKNQKQSKWKKVIAGLAHQIVLTSLIQMEQEPTQCSFHLVKSEALAERSQSHSDEKNRFHIDKNEEKPCSTCLKTISPQQIHSRYQTWILGELNCH